MSTKPREQTDESPPCICLLNQKSIKAKDQKTQTRRESTVHNGDSVTAIFKAALQFIQGEGKAVFKEFEKDEGPPKLCVIL